MGAESSKSNPQRLPSTGHRPSHQVFSEPGGSNDPWTAYDAHRELSSAVRTIKKGVPATSGVVRCQSRSTGNQTVYPSTSHVAKPAVPTTIGVVKPAAQTTSEVVQPVVQTTGTSGVLKPTTPATSKVLKPTPTTSGVTGAPPIIQTHVSHGVRIGNPIPATSGALKPATAVPASSGVVKSTISITGERVKYPDLRCQSTEHGIYYMPCSQSAKGNAKNRTEPSSASPEPVLEPSCPPYSLLDSLEGPKPANESFAFTVDLGSPKDKNSGNPHGLQSPILLLVPERQQGGRRYRSPVGNECSQQSHLSAAGANRRPNQYWKNMKKTKNKSEDNSTDPPKYEDVVAQPKVQNKTAPARNNTFQRQFKGFANRNQHFQNGPVGLDRGPKNVDALNDLIKKEFGSLGEPTHNLPVTDVTGKIFSRRNSLYFGNLPTNVTREDVDTLMAPYGEIVVDFHSVEKNFAFVRLNHREEAENAQRNLDGYVFKGRTLRVRLANRNICFKVMNLDPWVTNELLKKAFSAFGEVERAEIIIEVGKPTGEGLLEFSERRAGKMAQEACVENCFVLTSSLRPVILEEFDPNDCPRGYSERQINKNNPEYKKSREVGPRFLAEGSQENNCAVLWKSFYERRKRDEEELAKKFKEEERLLEEQIRSMMR